jgi:hypothetical protein
MATRATSGLNLSSERLFFISMALIVLLSTFIGFAPSFYLRGIVAAPHPFEPLTPLVLAHGLIFSAWILLFTVQVALVGAGRLDLHRRLGILGFGLIALMIPLGILAGIYGIGRPLTAPPGLDPRSWAALPLLDVPVFGGLILVGLMNRRRPQVHKRLMLIAMVDMLHPTLGRALGYLGMPGSLVGLTIIVFLIPLIIWDLRHGGKVRPATAWGSGVVAARILLTPVIWGTAAWMSFAGWLYSLI